MSRWVKVTLFIIILDLIQLQIYYKYRSRNLYLKISELETNIKKEKDILRIVQKILEYSYKKGVLIKTKNVFDMIYAVDKYFDLFDLGDLKKEDIYALFMLEVPSLDNEVIGKHGEIGIGQLLPSTIGYARWYFKDERLDPYKIDDNVKMTLLWLQEKIKWLGSVELGIIGYNGLQYVDGKINNIYLKRINEIKKIFQKNV